MDLIQNERITRTQRDSGQIDFISLKSEIMEEYLHTWRDSDQGDHMGLLTKIMDEYSDTEGDSEQKYCHESLNKNYGGIPSHMGRHDLISLLTKIR